MLQLYYFHGATCGLKVRLALSEKTVEYDHIAVEREFLKSETYRKLNPEGVVPTLIHDGNVILESNQGIKATGNKIDFNAKNENIHIEGEKSLLQNNKFIMNIISMRKQQDLPRF